MANAAQSGRNRAASNRHSRNRRRFNKMYVGCAHTTAATDHRSSAFDPVTREARIPIIREIVADFVKRFVRRPFFIR